MLLRDINERPVAWREAGEGPTIIFLHGLGGSRSSWDPQLTGLSDEFRCVAWDMPGYGVSEPLGSLTFGAIADTLASMIAVLGVKRAHLVGESFGGMHALHTALGHPDVVDRMVVANSSAAFGGDGTDIVTWKRDRLSRIDSGETPADIAEDVYADIGGPNLVGSRLAKRVASFARVSAEAFRASVEMLPSHDIRNDLGSISAPTLVIAGELDKETPVAYAEEIAAGLRTAELEVLPGVGHIAASEVPALFNELVRGFLHKGETA